LKIKGDVKMRVKEAIEFVKNIEFKMCFRPDGKITYRWNGETSDEFCCETQYNGEARNEVLIIKIIENELDEVEEDGEIVRTYKNSNNISQKLLEKDVKNISIELEYTTSSTGKTFASEMVLILKV
jgi:hypothetical protein